MSTIHTPAGSGAHGVGGAVTRARRVQRVPSLPDAVDRARHHLRHRRRQPPHYPRLDVGAAGAARAWPFDAPQFLLLNIAIGGDLGGPVDDGIFPVTMEVDYVRVWQAPRK